jgi:Uma2 family endonuclease
MVHFVRRRRGVQHRHSARKLTYADYLRFPDDNLRHEIIDGEHYVTPSPLIRHQRISLRLSYLLQAYLEEHALGELFTAPIDALLSEFDIVVPDLIYLSNERAHFLTEKNLQGPPDLVVEILSPGTRRRDLGIKRSLYERVGVREYWLVDPIRDEVTVHRQGAGRFDPPVRLARATADVLTTDLLPGLEIPLEKLLA